MKCQTKQMNGYRLHFAKSDKFKEIRIRVSFRRELKKEEITISSFLSSILTYSTEKYPTQRLLAMQKQMLYGASVSSVSSCIGKHIINRFDASVINDYFTEKGNLEETIKLLIAIIFNPKVSGGKFDEQDFKITYGRTLENIETVREDKRYYAIQRFKELLDSKRSFSHLMAGNKKDLNKITPVNLYNFYKDVLKNSTVDIFVTGNIELSEIESILIENFPKIEVNGIGDLVDKNHTFRKKVFKKYEKDNVKQATIVVGGKMENITLYEAQYVSFIFNKIFGWSSTSKLFKTIREKYSLCYSISSIISDVNHMFYITAGIDKENAEKVFKLIKNELSEMEKGNIDVEDIENAKTSFIERTKVVDENSGAIIISMQDQVILNFDDLETSTKRVMEVTVEDLKIFAKKMKIEMVYMLYGGDENEEN